MRTKTPVSVKDIKTVLKLHKQGLSYREIAKVIGRSQMTAFRVVKSYPPFGLQGNTDYVTLKK